MQRLTVGIKGLELFQLVAQLGSVQKAAAESGLSSSTISHHLQQLQTALGVQLLDATHRPITLTSAGVVFLRSVDDALQILRGAETEAKSGQLTNARLLRLALVEDFDSEIGLALSRVLADAMPECEITLLTRASHDILDLLRKGHIDVGVGMEPKSDLSDIVTLPLLRDPFVLALPKGADVYPQDVLKGQTGLPFLRYSQAQFMGSQIEAQLRRLRIKLPKRFEIESNHTLLGTVADGKGWTITTPASYVRAKRFQDQITLHPFPGKGFARTMSVMTTQTYTAEVAQMIAAHLKQLVSKYSVGPALAQLPWLEDDFYCFSSA
jgi:DNA-binding transcriptional LysR family regulator